MTNSSPPTPFHFPPPWEAMTLSSPFTATATFFSGAAPRRQAVRVPHRACWMETRRAGASRWQEMSPFPASPPPPPARLSPTSACFLSPKLTAQGTSSPLWGRAALCE